MSYILKSLPLEVVCHVLTYLSRSNIVALSRCSRVLRVAMQPYVMPVLTIEVDSRGWHRKLRFRGPSIHDCNIQRICVAVVDHDIQYYLESVTELIIQEKDSRLHNFQGAQELAEQKRDNIKKWDAWTAFNFLSPCFLIDNLPRLRKITVKCGYRCLQSSPSSPQGFNSRIYWQHMASIATNAKVHVHITDHALKFSELEPGFFPLQSEKIAKCVVGVTMDTSHRAGDSIENIRNRELLLAQPQIETLHIEETGTAAWPATELAQSTLKTLVVPEWCLPVDLTAALPSLVKLVIMQTMEPKVSNEMSLENIEIEINVHPNVTELEYLYDFVSRDRGFRSTNQLRSMRFPNLSKLKMRHISRTERWTCPTNSRVNLLLQQTLSQSTKLEEFIMEGAIDSSANSQFFNQVYAFDHSLRVFSINSIDAMFYQGILHWRELRFLDIYELQTEAFTIEDGEKLLERCPHLQHVMINKFLEQFIVEPLKQDFVEVERAYNELCQLRVSSTRARACQLVLDWAIGEFGRQALIDNAVLPPLATTSTAR